MNSAANQLNPAQTEAAQYLTGPLMIVAGAGAGKTKTIIHRILNLIESGVAPSRILAITFTNKAAGELKERLRHSRAGAELPLASTFHALGVQILRAESRAAGLHSRFNIIDKEAATTIIKNIIKEKFGGTKLETRSLLAAISRAKNNGQSLKAWQASAHEDWFSEIINTVWTNYEQILTTKRALDFDDLLLKTLELLNSHDEIRAKYQQAWSHLHVDEYQDTNLVQYRLSRLLAAPEDNLCIVGDVDQSIYSWRGADFRNMFLFQKDYPTAKTVWLEENYRSTPEILAAANQVISKNKQRPARNLFTRQPAGAPLELLVGWDENHEARLVTGECQELISQGVRPEEIAVLYRANFQSRVLEEAMLQADLPYQVLGVRFFERREIKDLLALLKASLNPADIESFSRAAGALNTGLGKVTLTKLFSGQAEALGPAARQKIKAFQGKLERWRSLAETLTPSTLIKQLVSDQELMGELVGDDAEADERLANLKELASLAAKYDGLRESPAGLLALFDEAALVADQDTLETKQNRIRLLTVHAAKGLEFRIVFVVGLELGLFPMSRSGKEESDPEEERRLFYVAITRAKERLFLSYAETRTLFGSRQSALPSEFLGDLTDHLKLDPISPAAGTKTNWLEIEY